MVSTSPLVIQVPAVEIRTRRVRRVALVCTDRGCARPFAHLEGGYLIIESRHGGDKHTNRIAVSDILKLIEQEREEPNT